MSLRLSEAEFTALARDAATAGLTPSGYQAQWALATAGVGKSPVPAPRRVLLAEALQVSTVLEGFLRHVAQGSDGVTCELDYPSAQSVRAALDRLDEVTVALLRSVSGRVR